MKKYTTEDIRSIVKKENVQYLKLQFTDMLGTVKAVEVPITRLDDVFDNKIVFDGSSVEGFVRIKEADMFLHPDIDTFLVLSFEDAEYGKVARFICDVYKPDGTPFEGDPRYILKRQIEKVEKMGLGQVNVGFEPEFYLFKLDESGKPTTSFGDKGSYFDNSPIDGAEYIRREISLELGKLGYDVQTSHHEVGPGQNEVNSSYDLALNACDYVQTFKQVVKVIARKHNYLASFMPKPMTGQAGSGMHTNVSLFLNDKNIFFEEDSKLKLSLICRKWITGILNHCREIALLTNPTVNSYKRLVSGYEAPIYACWSDSNRSSLIRIPASKGKATRTEIRNVDPTANPYLAVAGIVAAGIDGINNCGQEDLIEPVDDNLFDLGEKEICERKIVRLPETLFEATQEFSKSEFIKTVIGEHIFNKLIVAKNKEWKSYHTTVSQWEIDCMIDS